MIGYQNLIDNILAVLPKDISVTLVGGAVRDFLLGREFHDLDFIVEGDVFKAAKIVADCLHGAYYPMDVDHGTARVILSQVEEKKFFLDFNSIRGNSISDDLEGRDFTINAMALTFDNPHTLIDPLDGAKDLSEKILRVCSEYSIQDDPLRILRGVRLSIEFKLHIQPKTQKLMRESLKGLNQVSEERKRDEIFKILNGSHPEIALRILDHLGALKYLMPEILEMKGVSQSLPHVHDVWEHTLSVLKNMHKVLTVLTSHPDPAEGANLHIGLLSGVLGRFRERIKIYCNTSLNPDRSHRSLLMFSALYHDAGKPVTRTLQEDGRIRFFNHEEISAKLATERSESLHLSHQETLRIKAIINGHMRPLLFVHQNQLPTPKAIYRFFRDFGEAGVDICLLSLADTLATHGSTLPPEVWKKTLETICVFLESWWDHPEKVIQPPSLLNGNDLIHAFDLPSGPMIGKYLEAVREAQVDGKLLNHEEAMEFVRQLILSQ